MPPKGRPRKVAKPPKEDILTLLGKAQKRSNSPLRTTSVLEVPSNLNPSLNHASPESESQPKKRGRPPKKSGSTPTTPTKSARRTVQKKSSSLIGDHNLQNESTNGIFSASSPVTPRKRAQKREVTSAPEQTTTTPNEEATPQYRSKPQNDSIVDSEETVSPTRRRGLRRSRSCTPQIQVIDSDGDIPMLSEDDIRDSDGDFNPENEPEEEHENDDEPMAIADEVLELNGETHDEDGDETNVEEQPKGKRGRKKGGKNKPKDPNAPRKPRLGYSQGIEISKTAPDQLSIKEADTVIKHYFNSASPFAKAKEQAKNTGAKKHRPNADVRTLQYHGLTRYFKKKLGILDSILFSDYYNFSEDAFEHAELNNLDELPKVQDCHYMQVSKQQFEIDLPLINKLTLTLTSNETAEQKNEEFYLQGNFKPVSFSKTENRRSGFVFNCGGLPLVTTWLDKTIDGNKKYLLVSVYSHGLHFEKPSDLSIVKLNKLSVSYKDAFNSGLFIYEYDMDRQTLNLNKKLYFNKGSISRMKWLPCTDPSLDENLLACVFQDGSASIIKVNSKLLEKTDHLYYKLIRCSIDIKLPEFKIFSIDWTSNTNVVCGLNDGFIAEFDITSPDTPLYIHPLEIGTIHHISTCYSNKMFCEENEPLPNVALISSNNFSTYMVDLNDLTLQGQTVSDKSVVKQGEYSALLDAFFYEDQQDRIKIATARESSVRDSFLMMEEPFSSLGISDYSHLVLTGHVNGAVRLFNYFRRTLIPPKSVHKSHTSLRILKMTRVALKNENKFNLNLNFKIDMKGDDEGDNGNSNGTYASATTNLSDNSINVLSCTLNNEPSLPGLMACSFANGLIVVEKLSTAKIEFK